MSRHILVKDERALAGKPCVICGGTFKVVVDHIIPYSKGGKSDLSNLQPLCWQCNAKKGNRMTNDELRKWFEENKDEILRRAERAKRNLGKNPYDWD